MRRITYALRAGVGFSPGDAERAFSVGPDDSGDEPSRLN